MIFVLAAQKMIFFEFDYYEDIIIKFNELPHDIKESLSEFLNFDENYNRNVMIQIIHSLLLTLLGFTFSRRLYQSIMQ